jgi:signal transduction histidine kinase
MKLIKKIALIYGISTFIIVILSGTASYYLLETKIEKRIDSRLKLEKDAIQKNINRNPSIILTAYNSERIRIDTLTPVKPENNSDSIYSLYSQDELDKKVYKVRVLRSTIIFSERSFLITIKRGLEGTTLFAESLFFIFLITFTLMFTLVVLVQVFFVRNAWRPFYETLSTLKKSNLHKETVVFDKTNIKEFNELNTELNDFSKRTRDTFILQKQYSENLSHELLTPLAIIRSKTELLLQAPNLSEQDLLNLDSIIQTVGRLHKVNQGLILLSKIENNQFIDKKTINIKELLNESLENFEDQIRLKHLEVRLEMVPDFELNTNPTLLTILVFNLIKNSIFHNIDNGDVKIMLQNNLLTITNTGAINNKNGEYFFNRFVSDKPSENSIGLGLSIAKRICDLFGYKITYKSTDNKHTVSVSF